MTALGGWLDVQSAPGIGTTATLVLPLGGEAAAQRVMRNEELGISGKPSDHSTLHIPHSTFQQDTKQIRVLLVDDHAMVRQGLRSVLDSYPDIEVVGEAWNGEEAVACAERFHPSIIVMDINMPKMNGIEATRLIKERRPETIVIGISVQAGGANETAMKQAGAAILLTKEAAVDELYRAIQTALNGR
jgi:CheY-like chemotaxis protein